MGASAPHAYALWAKPFLLTAFGVRQHPLGNITESAVDFDR
jgi:hypothetical protein